MCALDASKAFDKVIRLVLWWKLAMKGICVMLLKALMAYYKVSKIKVQINNCFSDWIKTTIGNKQGGPISPEFYDQYGDEMTYLVEALMEGIMFGCIKVDIIQYADDVTLVAETAAGLQKQIDVCSEYGAKYGIQFNPDKTMIIIFNMDVSRSPELIIEDQWQECTLSGKKISIVKTFKVLGQIISDDGKDVEHVAKRKQATNVMNGKLQAMNLTSFHIHPRMKAQLFRTYIRPILTYGTENMQLDQRELLQFKRIEGNCLKRILRIPTRCRTTDLFDALKIEQTNDYLIRMKLKFILRLDTNELTKSMLNTMCNMPYTNSFISEIGSILNLKELDYETVISKAEETVKILDSEKKSKIKTHNENVIQIIKVLDSKNRYEYADKLFNLLKFEVTSYVAKPFRRRRLGVTIKLKLKLNIDTILLFCFFLIIVLQISKLISLFLTQNLNDRSHPLDYNTVRTNEKEMEL
jgi:hypothetical protein